MSHAHYHCCIIIYCITCLKVFKHSLVALANEELSFSLCFSLSDRCESWLWEFAVGCSNFETGIKHTYCNSCNITLPYSLEKHQQCQQICQPKLETMPLTDFCWIKSSVSVFVPLYFINIVKRAHISSCLNAVEGMIKRKKRRGEQGLF